MKVKTFSADSVLERPSHPSRRVIHQISKLVKTVVSHKELERIIQISEKEAGID